MSGDFVKTLPKVTIECEGEPRFHFYPQQVTKENLYWVFCKANAVLQPKGSSERILPNASGLFENLDLNVVYVVSGGMSHARNIVFDIVLDTPKVTDTFHSLSMEVRQNCFTLLCADLLSLEKASSVARTGEDCRENRAGFQDGSRSCSRTFGLFFKLFSLSYSIAVLIYYLVSLSM